MLMEMNALFFLVSAAIFERSKGTEQLGEEVAIFIDGDCQVRIVHRLAANCDATAAEEAG